jgi:hypothetical protein
MEKTVNFLGIKVSKDDDLEKGYRYYFSQDPTRIRIGTQYHVTEEMKSALDIFNAIYFHIGWNVEGIKPSLNSIPVLHDGHNHGCIYDSSKMIFGNYQKGDIWELNKKFEDELTFFFDDEDEASFDKKLDSYNDITVYHQGECVLKGFWYEDYDDDTVFAVTLVDATADILIGLQKFIKYLLDNSHIKNMLGGRIVPCDNPFGF